MDKNSNQRSPLSSPRVLGAPEVIVKFDELSPRLAKDFVRILDEDAQHKRYMDRHQGEMERRAESHAFILELAGLIFGFLISIFTVGIGAYTALKGQPLTGSLLGAGGVVGLASVFVLGRGRRKAFIEKGRN